MLYGVLNGQNIDISNQDELDFNFNLATQGVNVTFSSEFSPEFINARKRGGVNPYDAVLSAIKAAAYPSKIPFQLVTSRGQKINGALLPYATGNEFGHENADRIKVKWEYDKTNFFNQAQALSISSFITRSDFDRVRYIRENVPDNLEVLFIFVAITILSIQIVDQTKTTIQTIKEAIPTVFGTAADIGPIIRAIFNVIIQIVILALLLVALNDLLKAMSENLFQKPRAYFWLNVKKILEEGCKKLGYTFESSFFNGSFKDLNLLTATTKQGTLKSAPSNNPIPQKTLGQFFTEIAALFNGKIKVNNEGVVQLEPLSYYRELPPNADIQLTKNYNTSFYDFNTEELIRRVRLSYSTPSNDNHYFRDSVEVSYEHNTIPLKDLGIDGNLEVDFPYTIGKRKGKVDELAKFFNSIFDLFAGLSGSYKIRGGEREGYLLLENDQVSVDILAFKAGGEKIKKNPEQKLSAVVLYNNYYKKTLAPWNNQFKRFKNVTQQTQFHLEDCLSLADNPNILDETGATIQVTSSTLEEEMNITGFTHQRKVIKGEFGYIDGKDFKEKIITI